ncbi:MAG: class I SAM-dependent methyltransferase [Candidatus Omnitrophota bacterium]|nr:class I SAM-dependent methyltransferase [Candidatus Omnitrophota bacterium]
MLSGRDIRGRATPSALRRPVRPRLHWFNPGWLAEQTHYEGLRRFGHLVRGTVIDVGCGRQPYRHLFPGAATYVGLDLPRAPEDAPVDVFGRGETSPFQSGCADTILCVQVFDYVWEPHRLFGEFARLLRPGGHLLLISSQANREHDPPHDLFRVTRFGLRRLTEHVGLEVVELTARGGFWTMIGHATSLYLLHNFGGLRVAGRPVVAVVCGLTQAVCGLLDRLHCDPDDTLGHLLLARKPGG